MSQLLKMRSNPQVRHTATPTETLDPASASTFPSKIIICILQKLFLQHLHSAPALSTPNDTLIQALKMPKSKRAKVVHLSKVEKKDKEHRQKIYAEVQQAAETYPYIYVFAVSNMRNTYLKELRSEFDDSRYVCLIL